MTPLTLNSQVEGRNKKQEMSAARPPVERSNGDSPTLVSALDKLAESNKSINTINRGAFQKTIPFPTQTIVTVASNNASGSGTTTIYLLNNDILTSLVDDNGSGAGSITYIFNDNRNGNLISNLFTIYGLKGLPIKQVQLKMQNNTTGLQDGTALGSSNPSFTFENGDGSTDNKIIPIQSTGNPMYLQTGFLITDIDFDFMRENQLKFSLTKDTTATLYLIYDWSKFNDLTANV